MDEVVRLPGWYGAGTGNAGGYCGDCGGVVARPATGSNSSCNQSWATLAGKNRLVVSGATSGLARSGLPTVDATSLFR